ncbi:MAG TPA: ABC transporter permease [Chitinophagaceae bacterium]|nr:ABC transporter permease [Chitinophagaceae bacterium]
MFKNYFKIALRNLVKNKVSSIINIGGLAVGMAVAMLIGLWIYDELSFDKQFKNHKQIAQVIQNVSNNGEKDTWHNVPFPLGEELRKSYAGDFKNVIMTTGAGDHILSFNEKKLTTSGGYFEPGVVEMLSLDMLKGTGNGLKDPSSILLSKSSAKAFFGNDDPIGKVLKIDNNLTVGVAGVYEDLPTNSSFAEVNFIAPWELFATSNDLKSNTNPWRCNCYTSYAQVADNADMNKVSAKIKDVKIKKVNKDEVFHKPQLFLFPISKWHLYSEFKNGINTGGRIQYVWLFGIIGVFVLLLACINFMNLSTARSEKRAKEVGIRKSIGSLRLQLIFQFFCESLLVVALAYVLSLVLVFLALPFFNDVSGKKMSIMWSNPFFWLLGVGFSIITGLISGSYPALYLSSFKPVKVLKGTFKAGRFAAVPRKILVVLQFTVSVTLIIRTIVVFSQIQFAQNRPIGYSRDGLIKVPMITGEIHNHFDVVKNELLKTGAVSEMSESGSPTTEVWSTNSGFEWKGKDPGLAVDFPNIEVSYDYGKTIGWQFLDGRDFSKDFLTDSTGFVLNETAVKFMGLKNPVGETVSWDGTPFKVIGVIKDMIVESPYAPVRPTLFHLSKDQGNIVLIKINSKTSARDALAKIETVFKKYNPEQPFEYQFVDEDYAKKFGNEKRIATLASFFAILAIFISCLGLFGMASFVAEQRTKEIGVRKVLGASVFGLWRLLSKDFVVLVIISLLIAIPLAYYLMHGWLDNYQYRTKISWWIFAVSGAGAILITLLTVSHQAIKAAIANPVKSLRSE